MDKEGQLEATSWDVTLMPGGARGIALKLKFPLMAAWAERIRFVQEYRRSLRFITA